MMGLLKDRRRNAVLALGLVAVGLRLVAINQPFIEPWSWRQSDVGAIARNYYEGGFHFAYPQIDWAGDQPGYVGTEFPLLPFVAAFCYKWSGVHEWIGRVQAVILFAVSLPFFFLLLRETFGELAAAWGTFFYAFAPLNVVAGRSFMPDVPSLALALVGFYLFVRWLDRERWTLLLAAAAATSLALLIKLPNAVIGAPFLCLAWQKFGWRAVRQPGLWVFGAIALLPSLAWYWHAHQIADRFYPHHFFGAGGMQIESFAWYWRIARQLATASLTPILFVLGSIGAVLSRKMPKARAFHWWLAAMILFVIVAGYGNRHQWYQLPFVPIAAGFGGAACAALAKYLSRAMRVAGSILLAALFLALAFVYARPLYRPVAAQLRDAGLELGRTTPAGALVVAADNGDPTIFYYAKRKGWHFLEKEGIFEGNPLDSQQVIVNLAKLRERGATHLVLTANTVWWLDYYKEFADYVAATATRTEATPEYTIYELNPAKP